MESFMVEGRRMWDEDLILSLKALACQGTVLPTNRQQLLIEASDADLLAAGAYLRYFHEHVGFLSATMSVFLNEWYRGWTLAQALHDLAERYRAREEEVYGR